jgi:hypothetical protein
MSEAVYVVQQQEEIDYAPDETFMAWVDIATVTVPARTHRKTVIEKAVEENGQFEFDRSPVVVRVIPVEHAEAITIEWEQPPPRLKIG